MITVVEADAEKRTSDVLERAAALKTELEAGLQDEIAEIMATDKENRNELETQKKAVKKDVDSKRRALEKVLNKKLGEVADQDYEIDGTTVVAVGKGETITEQSATALKGLADQYIKDEYERLGRVSQHAKDVTGATYDTRAYKAHQQIEQVEARVNTDVEQIRKQTIERMDQLRSTQEFELLSEQTYREITDAFPGVFKAGMGAEAILDIVSKIDLD